MPTLRRTVSVLTFPAIAYLGACERTDTPTAATAVPHISAATYPAPTRWVNSLDPTPMPPGTSCLNAGYTTISAAVAVAVPGDVIQVCAGPYADNVLVNVMNLTLLGAQATNSVAGRTFAGPLESTVTGTNLTAGVPVFQVVATNVTIDGFSVTNTVVSGDAFGIGVRVTGGGAVITNNIIHMVTTPDPNGAAQAIYLQNGPDNVSILGNDLKYVQSNKSAKGVFVGDAASTDPSTSILIEGNSIANITSVQLPPSTVGARGAYGILINNGGNIIPGRTMNSGLVIRNNTISDLSSVGWVHAIGLEAQTPGVLVQGNSISNLDPATTFGTVAVWFEVEQGTSFATGHVNQNNLDVTILNFGIAVDPALSAAFPTLSVDGTCNWWGDPSGPGPVGPGAGARVSPNVAFIPWLLAPAPGGACAGGVPSGKVTGGGQVAVTGGKGSFGFNAKSNAGVGSGHLNYLNHFSGAHLDCTVAFVTMLTATTAEFQGPCSPQSSATSFMAHVEDNNDPAPGKGNDRFTITYTDQSGTHVGEGGPGTIISGNIEIHQ
jgi:hypothetical protein